MGHTYLRKGDHVEVTSMVGGGEVGRRGGRVDE